MKDYKEGCKLEGNKPFSVSTKARITSCIYKFEVVLLEKKKKK